MHFGLPSSMNGGHGTKLHISFLEPIVRRTIRGRIWIRARGNKLPPFLEPSVRRTVRAETLARVEILLSLGLQGTRHIAGRPAGRWHHYHLDQVYGVLGA